MVNLYKSSEAHKNTIKLFLLRVFNPFKRVIIFPHKKHKACCKKYKALILKQVPCILKYMACIFCVYKYLYFSVLFCTEK